MPIFLVCYLNDLVEHELHNNATEFDNRGKLFSYGDIFVLKKVILFCLHCVLMRATAPKVL